MKFPNKTQIHKPPVNPISEEDLAERVQCPAEAMEIEATISAWNKFAEEYGSFADEYSTL